MKNRPNPRKICPLNPCEEHVVIMHLTTSIPLLRHDDGTEGRAVARSDYIYHLLKSLYQLLRLLSIADFIKK
jgi:hypothetical protein